MNETQLKLALSASLVTVGVLLVKNSIKEQQLKAYKDYHRKMSAWLSVAVPLMLEQNKQHPEGIMIPKKLMTDIESFTIMNDNDLI